MTAAADVKSCRGCNIAEDTERHRLYHCPSWREVRNQIQWEQRTRTSKEDAERKHLEEEEPIVVQKDGNLKTQELGHASRRIS